MTESLISNFVKFRRASLGLTQKALAKKAGVGIRFIKELEHGKESMRMDKVNHVLRFFGHRISPVSEKIYDPYSILLQGLCKKVKISLIRNRIIYVTLIGCIIKKDQILKWRAVSEENIKEYKKTKHPRLMEYIEHIDIENCEQ
jgi:y4mF family transcriptional regulator